MQQTCTHHTGGPLCAKLNTHVAALGCVVHARDGALWHHAHNNRGGIQGVELENML